MSTRHRRPGPPRDPVAKQLLAELERLDDAAPLALIQQCASCGAPMEEALAACCGDRQFWRDEVPDGLWWMRLHAVMILGLIPTERAAILLVRFMRRLAEVDDFDMQDELAGKWPALFANKPPSVAGTVRDLATDRAIDPYMRACALDVVVAIAHGQDAAALDRCLDWLPGVAGDASEDEDVRAEAAQLLLDFPRPRHRAFLERLRASGSLAEQQLSASDLAEADERGADEPSWSRFADPWSFYSLEALLERQEQRLEYEMDELEPDDEAEGADDLYAEADEYADEDADLFGPDEPAADIRSTAAPALPKVGRNDPCPCGSGKKYKHCHLKEATALSPEDLVWRRVRKAIDGLQPRLVDMAADHFGLPALEEAWDAFCFGAIEDPLTEDSPHNPLFLSWLCHVWRPDPAHTRVAPAARGVTATRAFLDRHGKRLDPIARRYLEACAEALYSYHEVLSCDPGRGYWLKDVLLGDTRYVFEASGSQSVRRADLLFACLVEVEGICVMEASGGIVLPPIEKTQLIAQRRILSPKGRAITRTVLREYQSELRALFLETADRLLNPTLPAMQNTDGEPIELRTLCFEVPSAREAFEALKDLAAGEPDEALLEEAVYDAAGALSRVEFSWLKPGNAKHKDWQNTVLGHLRIDGTRLTAEVNSAERARRLSELIATRLGDRARELPQVVRSMESMLERAAAAPAKSTADADDLNSRPEVQAFLAEMTRKHYRAWVDQPIPALGNRTPRQAMRSADGREAVEALIAQLERDAARMQPPLDPDVTRELRETLGLPPAQG
jgi:hypothetical protein